MPCGLSWDAAKAHWDIRITAYLDEFLRATEALRDEIRARLSNPSPKADAPLVPLPEGRSYLGFIFARGDEPGDVTASLRAAHARLRFVIDREVAVVSG